MTVNRVVSTSVDVAHDPSLPSPLQRVAAVSGDVAYTPAISAPPQKLASISVDVAYALGGGGESTIFWQIGVPLVLA